MSDQNKTQEAGQLDSLSVVGGSAGWTVFYVVCPTDKAANDVDAVIRKLSAEVGGPYIDLQTSYDGYKAEMFPSLPNSVI